MREVFHGLGTALAPNVASIAVINMTSIQAGATFLLTVASLISTLIIIRHNLGKK